MYEPGLEFVATFVACLRAGVVAVPVPVPRRPSPAAERVRGIAEDADADVVPTDTPTLSTLADAGLSGLRFIRSDVAGAPTVHDETLDPGEPALLQYTSGSMSRPKGVVVTHANLWHQIRELDELWPTQPGEPTVSWLPMFHDMGLMFGLVMPIFRWLTGHPVRPRGVRRATDPVVASHLTGRGRLRHRGRHLNRPELRL